MKRPTEAQAARIEAKIERLRASATKEFFAGRYGRHQALTIEADALEREYHAACGVFGVVRRQLLGSLAQGGKPVFWVLTRNEDGAYVAPPGSQKSYTTNILKARLYRSREEAQRDACGNETPKPLHGEFTNA